MRSVAQPISVTTNEITKRIWIGRAISVLVMLFALFDGITKVLKVPAVIQASGRLGYSAHAVAGIGMVLLTCTALYAVPRTSVLGAVLLTGYLGGAVDANVHAGSPPFETLFPVIFGILVWGGLYLRDAGLDAVVPFRQRSKRS